MSDFKGHDFSERELVCIAGLPFDVIDMAGAVDRLCQAAIDRVPLFLSTPNLNFLVAAQGDAAFRNSVIHSDLSVADGMPLVWLARLFGLPIRERVAGSSLFEALRAGAGQHILGRPISVYFFGGPVGVAEKAAQIINCCGQHMICAGFFCPGFGSLDEMSRPEIIQAINESGADFLVVALGAKKGQAWIEHNRQAISVPVISHLGAVVNFVAGTVKRAPEGMQRLGLEWFWRIKEEPALFSRYWQDGIGFLKLLRAHALPYVFQRKRLNSLGGAGGCECVDDAEVTLIRFFGEIGEAQVAAFRDLLCRKNDLHHVVLDLSDVSALGPAFFGELLLLRNVLDQRSGRLQIKACSGELQQIFGMFGVSYLLVSG